MLSNGQNGRPMVYVMDTTVWSRETLRDDGKTTDVVRVKVTRPAGPDEYLGSRRAPDSEYGRVTVEAFTRGPRGGGSVWGGVHFTPMEWVAITNAISDLWWQFPRAPENNV